MKQLKYFFAGLAFIFFFAAPVAVVATPAPVNAACDDRVLGIPPWYRGLTTGTGENCVIKSPTDAGVGGLQGFITKIVLNVIEIIVVATAYVAAFFILYGGFIFIANNGSAETVQKAMRTIMNAIIGLAIALGAVAILNFVWAIVGDTNADGIPTATGADILTAGLNTAYFIAGVMAVIVIITAGITYATSAGDSGKVTRAKNQILYAVIGLILVLSAFTITGFISGGFAS